MRSRLVILFTAVVAMLGLVVPASVANASPVDDVKAAVQAAASELPAESQALVDELVSRVEAVVQAAGEVQAATPEAWDPDHQVIVDAVMDLLSWILANLPPLLPLLIDIGQALLPVLPVIVPLLVTALWGPIGDLLGGFTLADLGQVAPLAVDALCQAAAHFVPSFASLIGTACGFIQAILPTVLDLIPVVLPILVSLAGPLVGVVCDLAATLFPSQVALIDGICGFLEPLLA